MKLSGTILGVTYSNATFAVIQIEVDEGCEQIDMFDHIITASGSIFNPSRGMKITVEGDFTNHPKYGRQFAVKKSSITVAKNKDAVIRYLAFGGFKGIGEKMAKRIVDHFGTDVVETIIEKDPARLSEVKGITPDKAKAIAADHAKNFAFQELAAMNLTESQMRKLYDAYGDDAVSVMKKDPYQSIYDIQGFGFKVVDSIAMKNGIALDDPKRIGAALIFALTNISNEGHCWCTLGALNQMAHDLLPNISDELIQSQIYEGIERKRIINDDNRIYARYLYEAENGTAKGLAELAKSKPICDISDKAIDYAIKKTEQENGFDLDDSQREAIASALHNRVSVITGGPGTGKSTITKAIIHAWMEQFPNNEVPEDHIVLCAPTGKAARRMFEVTGVQAQTAQRLVMQHENFGYTPSDSLILLDEASMVDINLASSIMEIAQNNNQLVLIGDMDQLPPIGPGNFFRDCIQSPFIPAVQLELSHRQKGYIAINAQRINTGLGTHALRLTDESFRFIPAGKETVQSAVVEAYLGLCDAGYDLKDICCVVPMRKAGRSQTSAEDLNAILRERLNPEQQGMPFIKGCKFRVGDRVMNTENDYDKDIYNGDCGTITQIDPLAETLCFKTDDGRTVVITKDDAKLFVLAYAITIHKVQGSEFKAIVVAHSMEHYFMLQRNLLYTAITRAKEKVILVGDEEAVNLAIKTVPSLKRNTSLRVKIKDYIMAAEPS